MNILEALDAALPEMPAKTARKSYPKLDPAVIAKEHLEQGVPTVLAKMPGSDSFVRLTPEQWRLLELFDGVQSYADIAERSTEVAGVSFAEEDVKEFASFLRDSTDLFYKTPLEKNITAQQKLGAHRHKRKRFAVADITDISLHRWPRADEYLTWLKPYIEFIYTPWFTLLTLVCFAVMVAMWAGKFDEIWNDSFRFYNFTQKSLWDLVEFWFLFGAMAFFHESAHGMTCKHFGANVEKMEFLLMFFAPTFVCDVTQIWILGDRRARLYTVIAGIWADLVICFFATTLWWTTVPGMWIHDFAYKVIMVSGIGVTLLNLNPLIKLDGYYMFSEIIGEVDLKERSTLYVSDWVKKHIFYLPIEVEYVPRRRRMLYIGYALLSGAYGYVLIIAVVAFLYNVLHSYSPEFAWIPGLAIALLMFRSRIRKLVRFMKDVYLDKKERVRAWMTPARLSIAGGLAAVVLFAPVWPHFIEGQFVLEPVHRAVVRAEVPGFVSAVLVGENQQVQPGSELVRLRNPELESQADAAKAELRSASAGATAAALAFGDLGKAEHARTSADERAHIFVGRLQAANVASPIAGTVVTPRMEDLQGSYLKQGDKIAEIADLRSFRARIFIPEFGVREVHVGQRARLMLPSRWLPISGRLMSIGPVAREMDASLVEKAELSGIVPPPFYVGEVELRSDSSLREGMTGTAKLFVGYRSLASSGAKFMRDLVERRIW